MNNNRMFNKEAARAVRPQMAAQKSEPPSRVQRPARPTIPTPTTKRLGIFEERCFIRSSN